MTKDEKKYVLQKLKRAAVIAASAVTGLTAGGCATNNKKDDAVANNDIVFVEEQTEATTPVDTIETTTTTAFSPLNKDSNRKKSYDDDSVDSEYVETSYENDFTTPTTITSIKNSNKKDVVDDNTTAKTNSKTSTTTAKTNEKNPNTKIETNTKNPTTTARTNEKNPSTTKTTTKATTKPTTEKTTTIVTKTTTEAVTEPPVTEPVQRDHVRSIMGYNIEQIAYDSQALSFYSSIFNSNMLSNLGYDTMYTFDIGYGQTSFGREFIIFMIAMNPEIQDDCINANINYFDPNDFENYKTFLYNFKHVQEIMGSDIDFANYTIDIATGEFLNNAFSAEKNGTFDQFMSNTIASGNVSPNVLNNAGAMAVLYSCDGGRYLNYNDIDNNLNENFNRICNAAFGPDYIK